MIKVLQERTLQSAYEKANAINQTVKKLHSCLIAYVGGTLVARQLIVATLFPGRFPARQTGTGEQYSPLQEFFDSLINTKEHHPRSKLSVMLSSCYSVVVLGSIRAFLLRPLSITGTPIWSVNRLISGNFPFSILRAAYICPFNERIRFTSSSECTSVPTRGFTS